MFRLSPIRTKLWIAMTLLSVVLMLLSSSGLWGLYRYKQLAGEVSRQAGEIPLVGRLHRLAMSLRDSHGRSRQLRGRTGMIGGSRLDPLFEIESSERQTFENSLILFDSAMTRLETSFNDDRDQSVLVDDDRQQQTLAQINDTFFQIQTGNRPVRPMDDTDFDIMVGHLDDLCDQTDDLSSSIHDGMAQLSDTVKIQYRTFIGIAWTATAIAASLIAMLGIAFRSYVVKPFNTLLAGSRLVAEGHFQHQIHLGTNDELDELASAMNNMTAKFEKYYSDLDAEVRMRTREVIRNEQLASVGFLAAGVAHEINNPLAAVAWYAESLQSQLVGATIRGSAEPETSPDDAPEGGSEFHGETLSEELSVGLSRIESETYRCKAIIEKLLDFSRMSDVERDLHDLRAMTEDLVAMVAKVGKYRCMNIIVDGDDELLAYINPQEIRQVLLNLLTNALESVEPDGRVVMLIERIGSNALVTVSDNGCGMTDEVMEKLFEPFFTRRRDGTGTGLGLSITSRIVSQHGGSLQALSEGVGRGSTFRLELPTQPSEESGTVESTAAIPMVNAA